MAYRVWLRWMFAAVCVALVVASKIGIHTLTGNERPYLLFLAAVIPVTFFAGVMPGVVSTVVLALASAFFVARVRSSIALFSYSWDIILFIIQGWFLSFATALLHEHYLMERRYHTERRSKERMVAWVAHELKSPIGAILSWIELLKQPGRASVDRVIEIVERNARVQARIVEDLMSYSQAVYGKITLSLERVDLADIARLAVLSFQTEADQKEISVRFESEGDAEIEGDPARLHQAIGNLLSNAIKFTPARGRVDVMVLGLDRHVILSIADTGQGIRAEALSQVFDAFWQPKGQRAGGLGIGLVLVRHIVELHGGTVRAESHGENLGSVFTFTFSR